MFFRDILLIILSFLSGSIMYSYLIPKLVKGIDIRKISDDMNPGSGNVIKYCGIPLGILCIILDLFKAFIPVFISINYFYTSNIAIIFIAISPILGWKGYCIYIWFIFSIISYKLCCINICTHINIF